MVLENFAYI